MDPADVATAGFAAEGLAPTEWSNLPNVEYGTHDHPQHKVLYCVRGSIVFHVNDGDIAMTAGDRLDLPAGTRHSATVGPDGVTCWEAYRR